MNIKKSLTEGEKVIEFSKIARRSKLSYYMMIIVILFSSVYTYFIYTTLIYLSQPLAIIGIIFLFLAEFNIYARKLYVTTHGITEIERLMLISKRVRTVDMEDVINITTRQGPLGRILNYGEIHINTMEQSKDEEIIFPGLANIERIKKTIEGIMRRRAYYLPKERGLTLARKRPDKRH